MIYCAYCGKSFTRKEHLERHLPTHTHVKPYRCEHCFLGFSRKDLLSRHLNTYHVLPGANMPTPGNVPAASNSEAPIACEACATAKTACDKKLPKCTRCENKSLECKLRTPRRHKRYARREASNSNNQNHKTTRLAPLLEDLQDQTTAPITASSIQASQPGLRLDASVFMEAGPPMTINPWEPQCSSQAAKTFSPSPRTNHGLLYTTNAFHDPMYTPFQQVGSVPQVIESPWQEPEFGSFLNSMPIAHDLTPMFPLSTPSANSEFSPTISSHTRSNSILSQEVQQVDFSEIEKDIDPDSGPSQALRAMIDAEPAWPLAKCNRRHAYSDECCVTAFLHLDHLSRRLNYEGAYAPLAHLSMVEWDDELLSTVQVEPIRPETRDKMHAIAQRFLHKALDVHSRHDRNQEQHKFLVLPSSGILDHFLHSYIHSLQFYYSLVPASHLDPNAMIKRNENATLLVLFMIAQGASTIPIEEARSLSTALILTCRISVLDMVEKNPPMCANSTVHRCALIFILLAAWSGDKWLMDIAMGQRGMYLAMLQHAGAFTHREPPVPSWPNCLPDVTAVWHSWQDQETMNRLAYNWVIVDQELSLFYDTAPLLPIDELHACLPGLERWWAAKDTDSWGIQMPDPVQSSPPSSLYDLFHDFVHDRINPDRMTPYEMRLLLQPIQWRLWHEQKLKRHYSAELVNTAETPDIPSEGQVLLNKWRSICCLSYGPDQSSPLTLTNLALSHLISLNGITDFPEIEKYARNELHENEKPTFPALDAVYHCGQVLFIIQALPKEKLPVWWSVAIYRAVLILWVFSTCPNNQNSKSGVPFIVNAHIMDTNSFGTMWYTNPSFLQELRGPLVSLAEPSKVLWHAVEIIRDGISTRFSAGIQRKLIELHTTWYGIQSQHS
ncbi:hypothetical protein F4808DRAFT_297710 [Astrocystis sublimbata]|nr:hypothetical protein F4808DRAFT_297710 [Astrocystis sublimbata]